jgi:hypothetical protein
VELGFDIISVKQMTSRKNIRDGGTQVTLPRTENSKNIFKLTNLCNMIIKVEAYRTQNGLTQCYNCQQFGHVWETASNLLVACGVGGAIYTRTA